MDLIDQVLQLIEDPALEASRAIVVQLANEADRAMQNATDQLTMDMGDVQSFTNAWGNVLQDWGMATFAQDVSSGDSIVCHSELYGISDINSTSNW